MRSLAGRAARIDARDAPPEPPRHFLDLDQFDSADLRGILDLGFAYKHGRRDRPLADDLASVFRVPPPPAPPLVEPVARKAPARKAVRGRR